jgi:hypothetical protein
MIVQGINMADLLNQYSYMEQMGISTWFSPSTVEDDTSERYNTEVGDYDPQNIQSMVDKLQLDKNQFLILNTMNRGNLTTMLPLLNQDQLVQAMSLFPRDQLLGFIQYLPPQIVMTMLLSTMSLSDMLQNFQTDTFLTILASQRLQISDLATNFDGMQPQVLQNFLQDFTGQSMSDNLKLPEMQAMFRQLEPSQIMNGMKNMQRKDLFMYTYSAIQKDPQLLMGVPQSETMDLLNDMTTPDLNSMFQFVDAGMLQNYISQLPDTMLALAVSQIDTNTLSSILMNQYPDLVMKLATAAGGVN